MDTTRNGPSVTTNHPPAPPEPKPVDLRDPGFGNRTEEGTPHSPPESPPPYTSRVRFWVCFSFSRLKAHCHCAAVPSSSWLPALVSKGTRDAQGVICSQNSSQTLPYPTAYDKSPNRNAASIDSESTNFVSALDTSIAAEPYSCHVVASSSVPLPMSPKRASAKGYTVVEAFSFPFVFFAKSMSFEESSTRASSNESSRVCVFVASPRATCSRGARNANRGASTDG
mmetsp:Transcript_2852/g.11780  ORF Transcript_2852/g.11780 Transcript_2852/m.11780 type:complete len:226 (-) Transcript_2852:1079-1756(-)